MTPVLLALLIVPQDSLDNRVRGLVEKLGSDEISIREEALENLVALGEPALALLEKAAAATSDAEAGQRLKVVLERIRRNAVVAKVAPPAKLVTVSAKEVPLRDFLKDVCGQAGVPFQCDDASAARPVTLEARGEPLLRVVDRACAALADVRPAVSDGRLRVAAGKYVDAPSAYAGAHRVRIRKSVVTEVTDLEGARTSVVLYFDLDAQPDHKVRSSVVTAPAAAALSGGGEATFKTLAEGRRTYGHMMGRTGVMIIDGITVGYDAEDSPDRTCYLKEAPAGIRRLESLKVRAKFRYAVGTRPVSVPIGINRMDRIPDTPYSVQLSGQQMYIMATDRGVGGGTTPLEDLIDLDSLSLVDKDGKEVKLSSMGGMMKGLQYYYQLDRAFRAEDAPQLKYNVVDAVDRDVEFEFKDVKLRE
jgi:hypothetical protein